MSADTWSWPKNVKHLDRCEIDFHFSKKSKWSIHIFGCFVISSDSMFASLHEWIEESTREESSRVRNLEHAQCKRVIYKQQEAFSSLQWIPVGTSQIYPVELLVDTTRSILPSWYYSVDSTELILSTWYYPVDNSSPIILCQVHDIRWTAFQALIGHSQGTQCVVFFSKSDG